LELDLEQLKAWIGRTEEAEDLVTPRLVSEYRATLAPHLAPVAEGGAPLALHWCLAPPVAAMAALGPDGHAAKGEFLPPVPLPRRMWAGGQITTNGPLRAGDLVRRRSRIADVAVKQGKTGTLYFVSVDHEYATERGVALTERHDIVYREAASTSRNAPAPAKREDMPADLAWEIDATPTLLFRYSALTFNGHRIHYDMPYATQVEGYPGLVVHGPLQASLMFNLAAVLGGGAPKSFRYRGLSPLFAGQPFRVKGARGQDGAIRCWTENAEGGIAMQAEAEF
jgi:3-methylfumaryl-CoA hydratase